MDEPPPRRARVIADGPRLPVARRVRWAWSVVFEAVLIAVMLGSDASWPVRAVVIVVGTIVIASIHAYWREHGMPADGAS
jgi:hypothetical protein